jgi:hypothetical protein
MPPDERLSMADQLGAAWDKMEKDDAADPGDAASDRGRGDTGSADVAGEPQPGATERTGADRARDESGRFTEQPREKLTLKPREAKDAAPEQKREAAAPEGGKDAGKGIRDAAGGSDQPNGQAGGNGQGAPILPPSNWSGKGKVQWERLHHDLKVELSQELSRAGEASTKFGPVGTALAPYEQRLQQEFGGVDRGVAAILDTWKFARQSPVDFAKQFIQQYRIDPQALGLGGGHHQDQPGGNVAEQIPGDPAVASLQQRLEAIEAERQRDAEARATQQQQQIHADIQAFGSETDKASGVLAHPYFNDVKVDMGALMAAGRAKTMQEAYEKACWADPQIRVELQREVERKAAEQRKQAVEKARLAGGSVTGSPGVARAETHVSQSVRADLLKNWDAQEARV